MDLKKIFLLLVVSGPVLANQCYEVSSKDANFINSLINKMTVQDKVGQIVQGDLDFVNSRDLERYRLGSVLNGGNTSPNKNQYASADEWKELSKAFYEASPSVDGVKIPFIWGTDAVHGHNNLIGATIFPHNIGLGATRNPELMKQIGSAVALEVLSTGVIWTFAPALSVPRNDRWGRTYEGFAEEPKLVGELGSAFVEGLQGEGDEYLDENHILATSKHFAGDGGTFDGIDQGDVRLSKEEFYSLHVSPYVPAIDACTQTIMSSFNSFQGKKLHGDKTLLTDLLKDEMGFDGFIVGDWNGHGQVKGCSNESCPEAFNAGVDIYMAPDSWKDLHRNLIRQVNSGEISTERLDNAVRKILEVKLRLGLFEGRKPHEFKENYLGKDSHRDIARQAVRESLVLLKNNNNLLPIKPSLKIGVIGAAAQEIRYQTGGWTLDWQGKNNKNSDFPNVRSILQSIQAFVKDAGGSVEFSKNGTFNQKPDVVISVFGEEPYAEGFGDIPNVDFKANESGHFKALEKVSMDNIPVLSIFISGRPLVVNKYLNLSDAFVAAWLPGSEVDGISEVIFQRDDKVNFDFSGKLTFSWPKNKYQSTLNVGDDNYDPLFAFGYGLDYSSKADVPYIPVMDEDNLPKEFEIFRGQALDANKEFISSRGKVEFIEKNPFTMENGSVKTSLFQYKKQDDSKLIEYLEDGLSGFGITGEPLNLLYLDNPFIEVVMSANGSAPIYLNVGCGDSCKATVDLGKFSGDWETKNIPLSCFDKQGFDRSKITIRSMFLSPVATDFKIHTVKIKSNFSGKSIKGC